MTVPGMIERLAGQARGDGLRARLIRGGLGSAGIQAASQILALVLGIVLARGLGAKGYGIYAYAFAIMSLLMVLAEAGVPTLLMREVAAAGGREDWGLLRGAFRRAIQFVSGTSITIMLLGLLVLALMNDSLEPATFYTTGLMLFVLPLVAIAKTIAHGLKGLHRIVAAQALGVFRPGLVLALFVTVLLTLPELREPYSAMGAQLIAALIVLAFGVLLLNRSSPSSARTAAPKYRTKQWLQSVLPFTLIGGAAVINTQTDIIMLGWFGIPEEVGLYRVAVQGAALVAFSLQVADVVIAPQFSRLYAQGDMARLQRLVTQSARVILLAALPVALAFILEGAALASWVFGPEFIAAYIPLAILTMGQLVRAGFGSVGSLFNMTGHERISARILWQAAILNVVLNAIFIPLFGMSGAATATAISLAVWNARLYVQVKQRLDISPTAFWIKLA